MSDLEERIGARIAGMKTHLAAYVREAEVHVAQCQAVIEELEKLLREPEPPAGGGEGKDVQLAGVEGQVSGQSGAE